LDSLEIFEGMSNEQKGELFEAIRQYHLGNEPTLSPLLNIIFIPFKNQFDRDFIKYDKIVERNRANGNNGGRPPSTDKQEVTTTEESQENPVGSSGTQNNLDSKNKSDSKSKKDSKKESDLNKGNSVEETSTSPPKKTIEDRKAEFKSWLDPFREKYTRDMLNDFWRYWTEIGQKDTKMRFEKEKTFGVGQRLATWNKNESKFNKDGKINKRGNASRTEPSKSVTDYGKL